jgi:site-specific DNA-methyltransferase (adenine-specific)
MLKLIQGKMEDVLDDLPENYVDLIVTSPPYNKWKNRRTQKNKQKYWDRTNINYLSYSDKLSDEEYQNWQISCINKMLRVLKPTGTICYNHKDDIFNFEYTPSISWILKSDAILRQRIIWDRCGMQAFNPVRFYRLEEDIYILGKQAKNFKWNKEGAKYLSIWRIPPAKKQGHPCPFPIEIPKRCIESFTDEGDIVLDPFAGRGTTGEAAILLGRNFIGIDIEKKYLEIARERITNG